MSATIKGTLEIDHERGVIYFHPDPPHPLAGASLMRLGNLPKPIPQEGQLEILAVINGCNWSGPCIGDQ